MQAPGRRPQFLQHVHEVDDDVDAYVAAGGLGGDQIELVPGSVDEHDPGTHVGGVAGLGVVEDLLDDDAGVGDDRAAQPLAHRSWSGPGPAAPASSARDGDHVVGPSGCGFGVVDHPEGGDPFAGRFLSGRRPGPEGRLGAGGGLGGRRPQRFGAHRDALAVHAGCQRRGRSAWNGSLRGVEGVDINRDLGHQLLDLPFADHLAAARTIRAPSS